MPNLTARKVETLKKPGDYTDGEGLILRVKKTGAKSWILRTMVHGKRRNLGLGSASLVGLAEAREEARSLRKIARAGGDPRAARRKRNLTFWDAACEVHKNLAPTWKNQKHTDTWLATVENYAKPKIGDRPIETVGTSDLLEILSPIWTQKHETAKRLKQRLAAIFDWAKGAGHYKPENPVNGLKKALPSHKPKKESLAAMPWQELPDFMGELRKRDAVSARALEFIVLTVSRSTEAREARWSEIKKEWFYGQTLSPVELPVWVVPPERMKRGIEHRVPLSWAALDVLDRVKGLDDEYVFPSSQRDDQGKVRPQSLEVFNSLYSRLGVTEITTHGFRSSFKDWASEYARAQWEVSEAALSHAVGTETERSYARSDLFLRRGELMEFWADFLMGRESAKVVKLA